MNVVSRPPHHYHTRTAQPVARSRPSFTVASFQERLNEDPLKEEPKPAKTGFWKKVGGAEKLLDTADTAATERAKKLRAQAEEDLRKAQEAAERATQMEEMAAREHAMREETRMRKAGIENKPTVEAPPVEKSSAWNRSKVLDAAHKKAESQAAVSKVFEDEKKKQEEAERRHFQEEEEKYQAQLKKRKDDQQKRSSGSSFEESMKKINQKLGDADKRDDASTEEGNHSPSILTETLTLMRTRQSLSQHLDRTLTLLSCPPDT